MTIHIRGIAGLKRRKKIKEGYGFFMHPGPFITVVIPVFNGENYFKECLESVIDQDYKNFEVLVVDDGSHDPHFLREIIESKKDVRVRLIRKENGGVASALNCAIDEMKGDYLAWLSHDDKFKRNKLKTQVDALVNVEPSNEILYTGYNLIDADGILLSRVSFKNDLAMCSRLSGIERGLINGCTTLIHKSVFARVGYFDTNLRHTQDYDFWLRCINSGINFTYIDENLVSTRIHSEQDSKMQHKSASIESEALWLKIINSWLKQESASNISFEKEILSYREFVAVAGFSLAEERLNEVLREKLAPYKISIVIPTRKRPFLLKNALGSLESQSHKNFEVIIVEDDPDSELDIDSLINEFSFEVRFHRNQKVLGAGASRNVGISLSAGSYIAFLDSDDIFLPDKLMEQLAAMLAANSQISHTNYFSRDQFVGDFRFHDTSRHQGHNQDEFISSQGCTIATPTVMLRRDIIESVPSPFPDSTSPGEDISGWIRLTHFATSSLLHIQLPLTVVRVHTNSASKSSNAQVESLALIDETIKSLGLEVNIKNKENRAIFKELKTHTLLIFIELITSLYLRLPFKIKSVFRNNKICRKVYFKLRRLIGFGGK